MYFSCSREDAFIFLEGRKLPYLFIVKSRLSNNNKHLWLNTNYLSLSAKTFIKIYILKICLFESACFHYENVLENISESYKMLTFVIVLLFTTKNRE
jgi:hypothetical protein